MQRRGSGASPVLAAARIAMHEVLGAGAENGEQDERVPHLALCYSTAEQPAVPVIVELGKTLPACEVTIGEISLVVQDGAEDQWNWRIAAPWKGGGASPWCGSPTAARRGARRREPVHGRAQVPAVQSTTAHAVLGT
jgi:hypothetical protein